MNLSEDEIIEKYGKQCKHCSRNTLLPYDYEFTCFSCGCNVIKRRHELSKIQRKKRICINRINYAELKKFCFCVDLYEIYESNDYDKIYEVLLTLINKKVKVNHILIEKYKDMLKSPDFEQIYWSRTAQGIYKIGLDSIRLKKRLAYYDRSFYENINYYDMMGSVLKYLNEISQ